MGVLVAWAAGCSSAGGANQRSEGTSVVSVGPAVELAPSQLDASTVAPPETPPPCDPADIITWTAQVVVSDTAADAVIRLRNDGTEWCEVDVRASPFRDPRVEPDVWLEPGEWADLVIGGADDGCGSDPLVTDAPISLNGEERVVPTAAVQPCRWQLTAFFANETAVDPCAADALDVVATEHEIVLRNSSSAACVLGELRGASGLATVERADGGVAITALAAGDVVAFGLDAPPPSGCADGPAVLDLGVAGRVAVDPLVGCRSVELGPARPWFDGSAGPIGDAIDVATALGLLDPF